MAQDLESTKGTDLLAWITSLRHRRLRVTRRRTLRQSRIDLATQLGLHADDDCQLPALAAAAAGEPSRPAGSDHHLCSTSTVGSGNAPAASASDPNVEHERSSQMEEKGRKTAESVGRKPPLTERRRQQLEKIRALAAELKPSRGGRGRGRGGRGGGDRRGNLASPSARTGAGHQQRRGSGGRVKRRQPGSGRGSGAGSSRAALSVQEDGYTMDGLSSMAMEGDGGGALLDADDNTNSRLLVDGPGTESLLDKFLDPDADCEESVNGGSAVVGARSLVSARQTGSEDMSPSRGSSAATTTMFASSSSSLPVQQQQQPPADESEDERDQLAVVDSLLALYDPEACRELGTAGLRAELSQFYQLHVDTELLRACELPFQPSFMGSCEAGLADCFDFVLRDLRRSDYYCCSSSSSSSSSSRPPGDSVPLPSVVFLAGGLACLPGLAERTVAELRALLPCSEAGQPDSELCVVVAENPRMDAWRGARQFVLDSGDDNVFTTRQQYDEYGADYFAEHALSNPFWLKKH